MSKPNKSLLVTAALLLMPAAGLHVVANEALVDRITASADRLELDQQTGVQTLTGNVVITQGDISISGNSLRIATRNGAISRIFGAGEPIRFQQQLTDGEVVRTESNEIDYLTSSSTLVFRGGVTLQRGEWQLDGHAVEYNIRSRDFRASGSRITDATTESQRSRVSITYNRN